METPAPTPSPLRSKILARDQLLALRERARAEGRSVVQCHGCFDIVHPGHIRHLEFAAQQGDILLVTITDDPEVNKGDGRPLFSRDLRAQNMAALGFVDWVHINPDATAEALLDDVRPDRYIKGREYETNDDPRFAAERAAVERHGGRVVFSSGDIVFSSTALVDLLERHADPFHASLRRLMEAHDLSVTRLRAQIDAFAGQRIVVVGETITDTYVMCDRPEVAGESPVMSLRPLRHVSYDGGSAVVARHLARLGAHPTLITALPPTPESRAFRDRMNDQGIDVHIVPSDGPAPEKQRFLVGNQKVVKLDMVRPITLDEQRQRELAALARAAAPQADAFIVTDFGLGLLTHRVLNDVISAARQHDALLAGDVSGRRSTLARMTAFDLICPTEVELRDAMQDYDDSLNAVAWRLLARTRARNAIVKLGGEGLIAFSPLPGADRAEGWTARVRAEHIPALTPYPIDTLGCGDAMLSAATLTMLAGGSLTDAAFLGAIAASAHASRLGNDPVERDELIAGLARTVGAHLAVETANRRALNIAL